MPLQVLRSTFAVIALVLGVYWITVEGAGLAIVSVARPNFVYEGSDAGTWAFMTGLVTTGIAACAQPQGLLAGPTAEVDRVQRCVALLFAFVLITSLPLVSVLEVVIVRTSSPVPSLWPIPLQELLLAAPALCAAASMYVCAELRARMSWWLRSGIPAGLFLGGTALQFVAWPNIIVPAITGSFPVG